LFHICESVVAVLTTIWIPATDEGSYESIPKTYKKIRLNPCQRNVSGIEYFLETQVFICTGFSEFCSNEAVKLLSELRV
jgi:hypothetical protein